MVKNPPAMLETWAQSLVGKIPWRRERLPTPIFWPREFHGLYSSCYRKTSDTTERLSLSLYILLRIKQMANEIQPWELYSVLCGQSVSVCVCSVAQSCLILCGLMDCSPPSSSVHGISQGRILEWIPMPSSRGSSQPRDRTSVSCICCIAGEFF